MTLWCGRNVTANLVSVFWLKLFSFELPCISCFRQVCCTSERYKTCLLKTVVFNLQCVSESWERCLCYTTRIPSSWECGPRSIFYKAAQWFYCAVRLRTPAIGVAPQRPVIKCQMLCWAQRCLPPQGSQLFTAQCEVCLEGSAGEYWVQIGTTREAPSMGHAQKQNSSFMTR